MMLAQKHDFATYPAPVLTVFDQGGNDTLDLSGDTVAAQAVANYNSSGKFVSYSEVARTETVIDLREGHYSSTHGMVNNIGIAFGTVIENAVGTIFNDTMHGNSADNKLLGGSGQDQLFGYDGNDYLDGGQGADTINGGAGNDTIVFDPNDNLNDINGGDGFDTLLFEMVWFSVDLFAYGFEQSALRILDAANSIWSEIVDFFNLDEVKTETITTYDDGTFLNSVFDVDDTEEWTQWDRLFDFDGTLLDETFILDGPGTPPVGTNEAVSINEQYLAVVTGNLLDNDLGKI